MVSTHRICAFELPAGGSYLGIVAKRCYRIRAGHRAEPSAMCSAITEDIAHEESTNPEAGARLVHDLDLSAFAKPLTDILVRGSAHARTRSVTMLETGVQLGAARKAVRVWGDRRIALAASGGLELTRPESFTCRPVRWDDAYGGRDIYFERHSRRCRAGALKRESEGPDDLGAVAYPRNRSGRGFFVDLDRERIGGQLAPSLEDPADPVTAERLLASDPLDWLDRPHAACYEPIDWLTYPRALFAFPPDAHLPTRPVHELALGGLLRADLEREQTFGEAPDARFFNCAPAGLAVTRLGGGERACLWNLHRDHGRFEFDLPGDAPRMLLEPPGCGVRELPPTLQTVLIEPDEDRVTLTWSGALETAARFPDDLTLTLRHAVTWSA